MVAWAFEDSTACDESTRLVSRTCSRWTFAANICASIGCRQRSQTVASCPLCQCSTLRRWLDAPFADEDAVAEAGARSTPSCRGGDAPPANAATSCGRGADADSSCKYSLSCRWRSCSHNGEHQARGSLICSDTLVGMGYGHRTRTGQPHERLHM